MNYTDVYETKSNYIKVDDLQKKRIALTIDKVIQEKIGEDAKLVLTFRENEKKFVLNKTNCRMLEMLTDSGDTDNWEGLKIILRPDMTTYNGKPTPCVRVDSELPSQQAKPAGSFEEVPF